MILFGGLLYPIIIDYPPPATDRYGHRCEAGLGTSARRTAARPPLGPACVGLCWAWEMLGRYGEMRVKLVGTYI